MVIYDPNHPPTLWYSCGVFVEICRNIVDALAENSAGVGDTNGRLTTMLHYSPDKTNFRRGQACRRFNEKCKQFYSCDTRYSSPDFWRTSCDEFPFGSSVEGGKGAHLRCVSPFEQDKQGSAQGMLGLYMAELVTLASGAVETRNWASLATGKPSFSRPYTFIIDQMETVGNNLASLLAPIDGGKTTITFTRNARNTVPVAGTYNYDSFTFRASNKITRCSCPTGLTTSCSNCISTRRPPFGTNPPDGGGPYNNNKIHPSSSSAKPKPTPAPPTLVESRRNERIIELIKRITSFSTNITNFNQDDPNSVAKLMAQLKLAQSSSLFKRQQDSCPKEETTPEDEASDQANDAQDESFQAEDQANALSNNNSQKSKAIDASRKAEAAADQALNFLNAFVGPEVVSSAAEAALAAAALLNVKDPAIAPIYSKVTSVVNQVNSVISIASANPTAFTSTCTTNTCSPSDSDDGGPTFVMPPPPIITSSSTTSSGSSPTGVPGQNGCFIDQEERIWGVRVPEQRPSYACYEDFAMIVEEIPNSKRVRLFSYYSGDQVYLSWTPDAQNHNSDVNVIQLLTTDYDTALTMEWQVDLCGSDKGARISPYWNGAPFPNFAIELLTLIPMGSPSAADLQSYKESLKITTYTDQYFTMLPPGAKDPVAICSDKYPSSSQDAAAKAHAQTAAINASDGKPTNSANGQLIQQASAWPTGLLLAAKSAFPTPKPTKA